jgi:N-acetylmuramoyl-L-alanine amidase
MHPRLLSICLIAMWLLFPMLSAARTATTVSIHKTVKTKSKIRRAHVEFTAPTIVRDIRVRTYPDYHRLVLDLQRGVTFTQSRQDKPARVVIELKNSLLAKTVKAKIAEKEIPEEITITEPRARSVAISLNLESVRDYRVLPLTSPARLVLDVYSQGALGEPVTNQPAPAPAPTQIAEQSAETTPPGKPAARMARADIKTIVIDPGHGGKDPGAMGRGGTAEKDITLQVAMQLRDLISKKLGRRVLLTREKDVFIELEDRARYANTINADLFISVHVNSHPQRATRGVEIYHFGEASDRRALEVAARENGTPINETGVGWQYLVADLLTTKKVQESLELAWTAKQAMLAHLDDHYDVMDHGVKTAPFYVLRYTAMPSILAEIAFISNPTEERLMQSDLFLTRMAEAIFEGVKAFIAPLQTASR